MKVKRLKWRRELDDDGTIRCYHATGIRRDFTLYAAKTSYGDYVCRQFDADNGLTIGQLNAPTVAEAKAKAQQLHDADVMAAIKKWMEGVRDGN